MKVYHANEFTLQLPPELKDKTHHIFALSHDGPSEFNLVISRNPAANDLTLEAYAEQLLGEMKKALPQFQLLQREDMIAAEEPALRLNYRWLNQGTRMQQNQVSFFTQGDDGGRQVIQVTATTTGEKGEKWSGVFRDIVSSIKLRSESSQVS